MYVAEILKPCGESSRMLDAVAARMRSHGWGSTAERKCIIAHHTAVFATALWSHSAYSKSLLALSPDGAAAVGIANDRMKSLDEACAFVGDAKARCK